MDAPELAGVQGLIHLSRPLAWPCVGAVPSLGSRWLSSGARWTFARLLTQSTLADRLFDNQARHHRKLGCN